MSSERSDDSDSADSNTDDADFSLTRDIGETASDAKVYRSPAQDKRSERSTKPKSESIQSVPSEPGLLPGHVVSGRYEIRDRLGRGGFGAVYRAHDRDLNRIVAIKQSHGLRSFVAGQIRNEAQSVASLNHPNIISIHDLITISDSELLIVMECLDGETLSTRMRESRLEIHEAIGIATQIAGALQHAHERLLVHSDLKPGNLFLSDNGLVKLLDFGLAVAYFPDELSGEVGGTPGYMSPEQIRGESHRIDGRADIFAFGVVLYEMLCGAKPFVGSTVRAVCDATLRKEVPPLRQLNPLLDEELQRITLKCLEKRIVDRYDSAAALESDLKFWLEEHGGTGVADKAAAPARDNDKEHPSVRSSLRLKSRGLQPFIEADAESYLALIPGPRNRDGVPDSILFWQRWVESDDPMNDYPVGVLYGPSGAGKTSYVRAGLFNQLDRNICKVYVECRPGDLGGRLSKIIQSKIHDEKSVGSSLRDLLTRLRSDDSHSRGFRKLLIVLDQFESWSHTASVEERHDFADALRQCDGLQIRALVVTRDDYWSGVRELLRWIELPLQEGRNVASVDLLDPPQAEMILEAMGRESGTLPSGDEPLSSGQQQFIRQAVEELAADGSIICVHLVMFAQMVRLQKWTPRGLRHGGGVAGACSLYFQELFEKSGGHSPEYRRVSDAVAPVLLELLPEQDSTVATVSVSKSRLAEAAQSAGCEHLLDDCLRILSEDLRIVTVIADDASASDDQENKSDREPTYRLSHDFLVRPINTWIDRVQSRTWRGRTKSRLSELSDAWSRRPVAAHLPGFFEYLSLLAGSRFQRRNESESRYLRAAARLHAGRVSIAVIALVAFMMMSIIAFRQRNIAQQTRERELAANVDLLLNGPATAVTEQISKLQEFGDDAARRIEPWTESLNEQSQLRAMLYMQSTSPDSIAGIAPLIEEAAPELFEPILELASKAPDATQELTAITQAKGSTKAATRAAILLAYLGQSSALESLLAGTDDANQDQAILLEAATWRGESATWLQLLAKNADPQVRFHAGIVLGTYPKDELLEAGRSIDLPALVNSPHAALHSVGRYLSAHIGNDPYAIALNPPSDADWRVGPDNIPMVRLPVGAMEYYPIPNSPDVKRQVELKKEAWFATMPVSRRLFNQFASQGGKLDDGSDQKIAEIGSTLPDVQKKDDSQPVLGINLNQAYAFCNWLSVREGLTPCYRYAEVESDPQPSTDYRPPPIPWEIIESGTGYRVPTRSQYTFTVRAGYRLGIPWKATKELAEIGGDYIAPEGPEYIRPLFTLAPNRFGLFVNDRKCGVYICSQQGLISGLNLGDSTTQPQFLRTRVSFLHTIFLVREVDVPQEEDVDQGAEVGSAE